MWRVGAIVCYGGQASGFSDFFCCRVQALGTGLQWLWHVGSVVEASRVQKAGLVVVVHGLSYPVAHGNFLD